MDSLTENRRGASVPFQVLPKPLWHKGFPLSPTHRAGTLWAVSPLAPTNSPNVPDTIVEITDEALEQLLTLRDEEPEEDQSEPVRPEPSRGPACEGEPAGRVERDDAERDDEDEEPVAHRPMIRRHAVGPAVTFDAPRPRP